MIMGKMPNDVVEKIKALSKATNKPVSELVERLKDILATDPMIQTMEREPFKIRFACAALYKENATGGSDCYFMLASIPRLREADIKGEMTTVGEVYALVQKIIRDEAGNIKTEPVKYAAGTFWRDGAKNVAKCNPEKVYKTSIKITENKWGVEITTDRATFTEVKNVKMPTIKEFYEKQIKPKGNKIGIAEIDLNKSENKTDVKIIEASVYDAQVGETEGREWGKYVVYDDTVIEKVGNLTFWFDPKDIKWIQGSLLLFIGHISERIDKKTNKTLIEFNPHFVLPSSEEFVEPYRATTTTSSKTESVDLSNMDIGEEESGEEKDN